jgi:hypothetical protein
MSTPNANPGDIEITPRRPSGVERLLTGGADAVIKAGSLASAFLLGGGITDIASDKHGFSAGYWTKILGKIGGYTAAAAAAGEVTASAFKAVVPVPPKSQALKLAAHEALGNAFKYGPPFVAGVTGAVQEWLPAVKDTTSQVSGLGVAGIAAAVVVGGALGLEGYKRVQNGIHHGIHRWVGDEPETTFEMRTPNISSMLNSR